jgi:ureidoglycolate dehydrogenase (NAD+)
MDLVAPARLEQWVARVAGALGYREMDAHYLAASLVDANLRGVDSHGVIRLPIYARRIESGLVDPTATPRVESAMGTVRVDAQGAPGQLAAREACRALVTAGRAHGVATATVRGSAHFGAAGFYARALAAEGFVALVVSNSEPIVVPFGGQDALLGTNPIAFAAPTGDEHFSLDMATSASAMGKVLVAQTTGESIPADWGVDANGRPTTDPDAVVALLPLGGAKGYALGMMVEILAGVLSGAAMARDLGNQYVDMDRPQNIGHWMLAIDVAAFMPLTEFTDRMQALATMVRATAAVDPDRPILLPGEPEQRICARRRHEGIPLPPDTVGELTAIGARYHTPWDQGDES